MQDLWEFARKCDLALKDSKASAWKEELDAAAKLLRRQGRSVPGRWPQERKRLGRVEKNIVAPEGGIPGATTRTERNAERATATLDRCVEAVCEFIAEQRRSGGKISRSGYARWCVGTGWPSPSRFERQGGWNAVKAKALESAAQAAATP